MIYSNCRYLELSKPSSVWLLALPDDCDNMPPPSLNTSAVQTSAVNGNSSFNATSQDYKQYFTLLGLDVKLTVSALIVVAAVVGFAGNLCVLRFTNNEEKKPVRARSSNLNFFIRSLAFSDVLDSLIGAPFTLAQINSNALMTKTLCKVSRYFQTVFIVINIYNLVVIGVERYICTCRPTSRPLSLKTVRKSVRGAWLFGFLAALVFAYPYELTRVDVNSQHYTVMCEYNYEDGTAKVVQIARELSILIIPGIILLVTCACIARMLWLKKSNAANTNSNESTVTPKWRQRRKKATIQLIVIIIAFIAPYILSSILNTLKGAFSSAMDFKTESTFRAASAVFVYLNSPINFLIHLKQLPGFRRAFIGYFACRENDKQLEPVQSIRLGRVGEPKGRAVRRAWEPERRRASMSQVQDAEKRRETQTRRYSF